MCSMFQRGITQRLPLSLSLSRRRRAVLSLKQLIHGSITKAEGLIEMFSHFSPARRRIINHSSVVYFEISFGVCERVLPCSSQSLHTDCVCVCVFPLKATHRLTPLDLCKWNKIKFVPCIAEWHKPCRRSTPQQSLPPGVCLCFYVAAHVGAAGTLLVCRWMLAGLCMRGTEQLVNKCVFTFCQ